ncbi:MAG: glycosyltransferase [Betaproteobacteria bacterium]
MSESAFTAREGVPAVSWLLCTHVGDAQLREALTSCFAQTHTDFECVVVVNGAEVEVVADTVRSWFGDDARLRVFTTQVRHLTFSLALGLHLARAPLVARMDGDDIALPDRLERQVEFMHTHPAVSVLGSDFERIDATGRRIDIVTLPHHDAAIRKALLRGNPLCHPSVMFRRDTVLAAGGYLGGIYAQDYDLWARLAVNPETKFANLPHVCLSYRIVGVGTARKARWAYASMAAAQYRNFAAGAGLRWGLAALFTTAKAILRSLPVVNRY